MPKRDYTGELFAQIGNAWLDYRLTAPCATPHDAAMIATRYAKPGDVLTVYVRPTRRHIYFISESKRSVVRVLHEAVADRISPVDRAREHALFHEMRVVGAVDEARAIITSGPALKPQSPKSIKRLYGQRKGR